MFRFADFLFLPIGRALRAGFRKLRCSLDEDDGAPLTNEELPIWPTEDEVHPYRVQECTDGFFSTYHICLLCLAALYQLISVFSVVFFLASIFNLIQALDACSAGYSSHLTQADKQRHFSSFRHQTLLLPLYVTSYSDCGSSDSVPLDNNLFESYTSLPAYYPYPIIMVLAVLCNAIFSNLTTHVMSVLGIRLKNFAIYSVYRKILRLRASSVSAAETLNVVTGDASQWTEAAPYLHQLWSVPLLVSCCAALLWRLLGGLVASLSMGTMFFGTGLSLLLSYAGSATRQNRKELADRRLLLCNELLSGIRIVKFFCWEKPFLERIRSVRAEELKLGSNELFFFAVKLIVLTLCPAVAVLVAVSGSKVLGLDEGELSTAAVWTSSCVCYKISFPIMQMGNVTGALGNLIASLKKLHAFLDRQDMEAEMDGKVIHLRSLDFPSQLNLRVTGDSLLKNCLSRSRTDSSNSRTDSSGTVARKEMRQKQRSLSYNSIPAEPVAIFRDVSLGWNNGPLLRDIWLTLRRGETLVIMGRVGSGKSTLLKALLGEAQILEGFDGIFPGDEPTRNLKVSYTQQTPFIFAGTVRENVLFFREFDEKKYQRCLEMSNLESDIALQFEKGDLTVLAERGGNLSGGQKMRLSLARSLYDFEDTDLLMFDDIFAALDNKTGQLICEKLMESKKPKQLLVFTANKDLWGEKFGSSVRRVKLDRGSLKPWNFAEPVNTETVDAEDVERISHKDTEVFKVATTTPEVSKVATTTLMPRGVSTETPALLPLEVSAETPANLLPVSVSKFLEDASFLEEEGTDETERNDHSLAFVLRKQKPSLSSNLFGPLEEEDEGESHPLTLNNVTRLSAEHVVNTGVKPSGELESVQTADGILTAGSPTDVLNLHGRQNHHGDFLTNHDEEGFAATQNLLLGVMMNNMSFPLGEQQSAISDSAQLVHTLACQLGEKNEGSSHLDYQSLLSGAVAVAQRSATGLLEASDSGDDQTPLRRPTVGSVGPTGSPEIALGTTNSVQLLNTGTSVASRRTSVCSVKSMKSGTSSLPPPAMNIAANLYEYVGTQILGDDNFFSEDKDEAEQLAPETLIELLRTRPEQVEGEDLSMSRAVAVAPASPSRAATIAPNVEGTRVLEPEFVVKISDDTNCESLQAPFLGNVYLGYVASMSRVADAQNSVLLSASHFFFKPLSGKRSESLRLFLPVLLWALALTTEKFLSVLKDSLMQAKADQENALSTSTPPTVTPVDYFFFYVLASFATLFTQIALRMAFPRLASRASHKLFDDMLKAVIRAPIHWFDTTSLGSLLNRFSYDTEQVDIVLPMNFFPFLLYLFWLLTAIMFLSYLLFPFFPIVMLPLFFIPAFLLLVPMQRKLKELQALDSSGIFLALINETVLGSTTIRSFEIAPRYLNFCCTLLNRHARLSYAQSMATRWLAMRLELLGTVYWGLLLAVMVFLMKGVSAAMVGISVGWLMGLSECCLYAYLFFAQTDAGAHSAGVLMHTGPAFLERDGLHRELDEGDGLLDKHEDEVSADLDSSSIPLLSNVLRNGSECETSLHPVGGLVLDHVSLRYRKSLPPVLNGLSVHIEPGVRCAVVGRTGAGKSSIAVAVFNLAEEILGDIILNGKPLVGAGVPVDESRRRIGIITQDPVIFAGSVRYNIDPFHEFSDKECENALESALLRESCDLPDDTIVVRHYELSDILDEGGRNMSIGERQLVCLARVLLREPELLVCDEATASCDLETDAQVQGAIREWLKKRKITAGSAGCCVLTIAHRLETIADYEKVLFLDRGKKAEFGSPKDLLDDEESNFSQLVKAAGERTEERVREIARNGFFTGF